MTAMSSAIPVNVRRIEDELRIENVRRRRGMDDVMMPAVLGRGLARAGGQHQGRHGDRQLCV